MMTTTPEKQEARFWKKVNKTATCWLWAGSTDAHGYGHLCRGIDGKRKLFMAHRYAYLLVVGPIPEGMQLDHLCRVRNCVNPDHLEPVTPTENVLRGQGWTAINARKTHCPRGHEFTSENTYTIPSTGSRCCIVCKRAASKLYWAKRRAA